MSQRAQIYQIKVTLAGITPPVWRRVLVRSDTTLGRLHDVIQAVMGWEDYHLHQFIVGGAFYGVLHPGYGDLEMRDERDICLDRIVTGAGFRFDYEYDFGDNWEHVLVVEEVLPPEPGQVYPVCLQGKRACPPEDVGGVWGYEEFLEAIGDPDHPEHEDYLDWIGGEFDPAAFDLEAANAMLRGLR